MVITWKEESMIGISVIMPVYNTTTEYLKESVNSILFQIYQNIEFIIIDDGSTDDTQSYLQSIEDERIKLVRNSKNLGITKSLNIGFRMAKD
jgi:glycosyltransferase involved in cell wall biosynthesis